MPTRLRGIIAAFALANLAGGLIAWRLILPVPALFSAVLAIALAAAWMTARPPRPLKSREGGTALTSAAPRDKRGG
jgi:membrane protein implicated in regulation of membrane protease activity